MALVYIADNSSTSITPRIIGGILEPNATSSLALPIKVDRHGRIELGYSGGVSGSADQYPSISHSTAYESGSIVKTTEGVLLKINGFNSGSKQFIQVFDSATHPSNGDVPVFTLIADTLSNFELPTKEPGAWFSNGIVIMNSTSGSMLKSGSDDCFFTVTYL